jgi:hypothetical protein
MVHTAMPALQILKGDSVLGESLTRGLFHPHSLAFFVSSDSRCDVMFLSSSHAFMTVPACFCTTGLAEVKYVFS